MNKVCVLGSINMDLVIKVDNMPKVGETILSKSFEKIGGGKGANQAIASKRSGNDVYMIGKIGKDDNGQTLKRFLDDESIDTNLVFVDEKEPTGMAMITVSNADNSIVVISGSNMNLNSGEIERARSVIENCDILISQFETPESTTIQAFKIAKKSGKITILNPAPAKKIDGELLRYTDIIIPNETEAKVLTGISVIDKKTAKEAGEKFLEKGIKYVIITLGANGVFVMSADSDILIDGYKVDAVDTTGAGDSFIGGLSSKLDVRDLTFKNVVSAAIWGNKVSSITVQREGAQPSIPTLEEVLNVYGK